ncbi:hypothetical protein F0562_001357 [Nyssa sinensis]|uniref:Uncharacterized protein n=1 Tax=Nyssa sinensis TaxID=561372 RepID=A0A5J5C2R0_9ASTE|nr:hypothetical protein F0562_001357 [Nyssa sinensis]
MASAYKSSTSSFSLSEQWLLMAAAIILCAIFGYVVYDAVMSTAAELLQRLLMISPLLLVIAVHLLSTSNPLSIPMPGSEPDAIHRAGGSPWEYKISSPYFGVIFIYVLYICFYENNTKKRIRLLLE